MNDGSESSPEVDLKKMKPTRMVRANFRARSASVPAEFTSLCSVRHIIEATDFGRIPRVELLRLDAAISPTTNTSNSLVDRVQSVYREREKRPLRHSDVHKMFDVQLTREPSVDSTSESLASAKALLDKAKQFKNPKPLPPLKLRLRHSTSLRIDHSSIGESNVIEKRVLRSRIPNNKKPEHHSTSAGLKNPETSPIISQDRSRCRDHNHRHREYRNRNQQQQLRRFFPVAQPNWLPARIYFRDENPYIMDAKKMGNLGRYFNHSCNPNVFVQNVFIDSHDPRFPEVAFFTKSSSIGESNVIEKRVLRSRIPNNKKPEHHSTSAGLKNPETSPIISQDRSRCRDHNHRHREYRNRNQQQQLRRFFPVAQPNWLPARIYFRDENPYIMDAKKMGNLGRYFNHSCNPNVFVQNVFIDSHDPRFPEVAFFTKRNIAVGEEMTWDYGYTVDAVPFKVLYCYCGEPNCRIRLL
ncbi:hypothetical protein AHF37_02168 [Paragonimus kellicotti]|nr:hypothetical protein AHF37_02168 [Paragonimus kellicotti]